MFVGYKKQSYYYNNNTMMWIIVGDMIGIYEKRKMIWTMEGVKEKVVRNIIAYVKKNCVGI